MKNYSVTVAFHPNENLQMQIQSLVDTGIQPIVVFNSAYQGQLDRFSNVIILKNESNFGLAKAINIGISKAISDGSDGFFLFDQDSLPDAEMIENLIQAAEKLSANQINFASIGPKIFNQSDETVWPVPIHKKGEFYFIREFEDEFVEVDYLITSGIFISNLVWRMVGGYKEDYFIDGLDIEWGYRAKKNGYKNFICSKAILYHNLGDKSVRILPFVKKRMIVHSAQRRFYMYRNFLWMLRESYIPNYFKIHYGKKLIKMCFGIIISPMQWKSLPMIIKGVWSGFFSGNKSIAKSA